MKKILIGLLIIIVALVSTVHIANAENIYPLISGYSNDSSISDNVTIPEGDSDINTEYDAGNTHLDNKRLLQIPSMLSRDEAVQRMRKMSTLSWMPTQDISYWKDYGDGRKFVKGQTYRGMPYTQTNRVSYEVFVNALDVNNEIYYYTPTGNYKGNDCSSAVAYAWGLVGYNTLTYYQNLNIPQSSIKKIGSFTLKYPDSAANTYVEDKNTLYSSYKLLKPGDALLVRSSGAGHIRLVESIDISNNRVKTIEQSGLVLGSNTSWQNKYYTFDQLYDGMDGRPYIPIAYTNLSDNTTISPATMTINKSTFFVGENGTFNWTALEGATYTIGIDCDGIRILTKQGLSSPTYTYSFEKGGSYSAYVSTSKLGSPFADSNTVSFKVEAGTIVINNLKLGDNIELGTMFDWNDVSGADSYKVRIRRYADDKAFEYKDINDSMFLFPVEIGVIGDGKCGIYIEAIKNNNDIAHTKDISPVDGQTRLDVFALPKQSIEVGTIVINNLKLGDNIELGTLFDWKDVIGADSYQVRIKRYADNKIFEYTCLNSIFEFPIEIGIIDKSDGKCGIYIAAIKDSKDIAHIKDISPEDGETRLDVYAIPKRLEIENLCNGDGVSVGYKVDWDSISEANKYRISIYDYTQTKSESYYTEKSYFIIPDDIVTGLHRIWVGAYKDDLFLAAVKTKSNLDPNQAGIDIIVTDTFVESISLDIEDQDLLVDDTLRLTATVKPDNAVNNNVNWTSSDPLIATVNSHGLVTARAVGTATITATTEDGGYKATCTVNVKVPVTGVYVSPDSANMSVNNTLLLFGFFEPRNATNRTVFWSSSNPDVATVDNNGLVTSKTKGSAIITVSTEDGEYTSTCAITVTESNVAPDYITGDYGNEPWEFGSSVSVSGDYAIVGQSNANLAYIFKRNGNRWVKTQVLTATGETLHTDFGDSVSISGDYAIVGAPHAKINGIFVGKVYVYKNDGTTWQMQKVFTSDDGKANDYFGEKIAISGDHIVIGVPAADPNGISGAGKIYFFIRNGNDWTQQNMLTEIDGGSFHDFGSSISISGDFAIVGAGRSSVNGINGVGKTYIYAYDGNVWKYKQTITAIDGQENDNFGEAVSISGNYAIVGAPDADINGTTAAGKVYIYERNGSVWDYKQTLTIEENAKKNYFGKCVAVSGDSAVIGAPGADLNGLGDVGKAYVFKNNSGSWQQQGIVTAGDGVEDDEYGEIISVSNNYAMIGVPHAPINDNSYAGKVYVIPIGPIDNPPTLTSSSTILGQHIIITFLDKPSWKSAIRTLCIDNTTIDPKLYTIGAGTLTLDQTLFTSPKDYQIKVSAQGYNENFVTQTILPASAPAAPTVTGVTEGQTYSTAVTPSWSDVEGTTSTATLDGATYTKGTAVNTNGDHTLVVITTKTDNALTAQTTVYFTIDTRAPVAPTVTGVTEGQTYSTAVTPSWSDAVGTTSSATLDGATYTKGPVISADGNHTLVVTATKTANGLTAATTVHFTIDTGAPAAPTVSGVTEGQTYSAEVTPSWTDVAGTTSTATLDGAAYTKGTAVNASGAHALVVTVTKTANSLTAQTTVNFTVNITIPVKVIGIIVTCTDKIIINGGTMQMSSEVLPENASDPSVTWSVTPGTGSATINQTGLLTAKTPGTVTVKATANDGSGVVGSTEITITAASEGSVKGYINLGSKPENGITITVKSGITIVNSTNTDAGGLFNIALDDGTYSLVISNPGYLTRTINNVIVSGNEVLLSPSATPLKLWAGDVNGDSLINISDLTSLLNSYNTVQADPSQDFNGDGMINLSDLTSLLNNYNKTSADYLAWQW